MFRKLSVLLTVLGLAQTDLNNANSMDYVNAPTPTEIADANTAAAFGNPQRSMSVYAAPSRGMADVGEAFAAQYQLTSWIATLRRNSALPELAEVPANWNPYTHIRTNWDDAKRKNMEGSIRTGAFENAVSPADVERIHNVIVEERHFREVAARSGGGSAAGALAAMATDPLAWSAGVVGTFWYRRRKRRAPRLSASPSSH